MKQKQDLSPRRPVARSNVSTGVLNIRLENAAGSRQLGKICPRGAARVYRLTVYLSKAKGGKEKSLRLSSHYGREDILPIKDSKEQNCTCTPVIVLDDGVRTHIRLITSSQLLLLLLLLSVSSEHFRSHLIQ